MNSTDYTPEQQKDISDRVDKANAFLKELKLQPACIVVPANLGNDAFALKPIAYLQDLKFAPTLSPIQKI